MENTIENVIEKVLAIEPSRKTQDQWIVQTESQIIHIFGAQLNRALGTNLEIVLQVIYGRKDFMSMLDLLEGAEAELTVDRVAGTEYIKADGTIGSLEKDSLTIKKLVLPNYTKVLQGLRENK